MQHRPTSIGERCDIRTLATGNLYFAGFACQHIVKLLEAVNLSAAC